ncbi:MAG: cation:proton antiporter [Phycisphaerales bacterium]
MLLVLALVVVMGVIYATRALSAGSGPGAIDAFGLAMESTPSGLQGAAGGAGLLLLGSWLFGLLVARVRLPKISGYLIFGAIVGPSALALVTKDQLGQLRLINDLAISLIALTAGGEIRLRLVKKSFKVISLVTVIQVGLIFSSVTALVYFGFEMLGLDAIGDARARLALAALVGTIASASSPAAAIAVISEMRARGRMAQLSLSAAVSKDMLVVAMFAVVIALAAPSLNAMAPDAPSADQTSAQIAEEAAPAEEAEAVEAESAAALTATIARELGGSALVGALIGAALAWIVRALQANLPVFVVLACFGISVLSEAAHLDALIVALVAGLMMENLFRSRTGPIFDTLEELSLPVYCMFFAVAGAKIDLAVLATLWPAALAIVSVRGVMIWGGTWAGARLAGEGGPAGTWLWTAFVSQAGVSLALASLVAQSFEGIDAVAQVYSLLLAAIAIHELVGPVLMKIGLGRGDVEPSGSPSDEGDFPSGGGGH